MNTATARRIPALDLIRGLAILGIFWVNQTAFAWPEAASAYPLSWVAGGSTQHLYWLLRQWLGVHRFLPLFAFLFGLSLMLQAGSVRRPALYRRLLLLGLIGAAHATMVWYGDILLLYAVCGLVALQFTRQPPRRLLPVAGLLIALPSILPLFPWLYLVCTQQSALLPPSLESTQLSGVWMQPEVTAYQGSWSEQLTQRLHTVWRRFTVDYPSAAFWETLGMMCLGIGFYRTARGRRWLRQGPGPQARRRAGQVLVISGFLLTLNLALGQGLSPSSFQRLVEPGLHRILATLVALALGTLLLTLKTPDRGHLGRALGACGRLALSLYLLQSLVATLYYYGLGRFGSASVQELILLPALFTALALWWAPAWRQRMGQGPAESLLRRLQGH